MIFSLLSIILLLACFIMGNALYSVFKNPRDFKFQNVSFLFACLMYTFCFQVLMVLLELSNFSLLLMGTQLYICIKIIISMVHKSPKIFESGLNKHIFIARSKDQIRNQIIRERLI